MSNEISKPENALAIPDWMLEEEVIGTEEMAGYIQPARLLIVQPTSKEPLNNYDMGTALIMPTETVAGKFIKSEGALEKPIIIVPIFFYPEFTLDNPRSIWPIHGSVRERSLDPNSEIAIRSQDPKRREEPCPDSPDGKMMRYSARLNFIVAIMGEVAQIALIQFKSAEYRHGMSFNSLIRARRRSPFGCQFALDVKQRKNDKGVWYGFSASNPPEEIGPWVQNKEIYEMFKKEHLDLAAAHAANKIRYEDDDAHEGFVDEPEM
jgi:hypothetical protein